MSGDAVNPDHYRKFGDYSPLHVVKAWKLNYFLGQVIKYIGRAGHKDPSKYLEDLQKAQWYLNDYIDDLLQEKWETEVGDDLFSQDQDKDPEECCGTGQCGKKHCGIIVHTTPNR